MNKLKQLIAEILKNKEFKLFFSQIISRFKMLKQNVVVNNIINNTFNFVKQHKIVSAVIAVGIIAVPSLVSSNSHYPSECRGLFGRTDLKGWVHPIDGSIPELSKLAFEEDPKLLLGKYDDRRRLTTYDDDVLPKLFEAKYSRLVTTSGKQSAELYREQLAMACLERR